MTDHPAQPEASLGERLFEATGETRVTAWRNLTPEAASHFERAALAFVASLSEDQSSDKIGQLPTDADPSGLVDRLWERAISYQLGGPSSEHTAAMLAEAADAITAAQVRIGELEGASRSCPSSSQEGSDPTGWRTMESAPKDGSRILLCNARGIMLVAWWHDREPPDFFDDPKNHIPDLGWSTEFDYKNDPSHLRLDYFKPTHWAPLPPPPESGAADGAMERQDGQLRDEQLQSAREALASVKGEEDHGL